MYRKEINTLRKLALFTRLYRDAGQQNIKFGFGLSAWLQNK